jgi:hypothetical protein
MSLKFQGFTHHGYEYVNKRSRDSKQAHVGIVEFPCFISGLMIRCPRSLTNAETSVTYEIIPFVILEAYG